MAEGFKTYLISLLLVGLFAIALINAGIMISDQNDMVGSIGDDSSLSDYKTSIEGSLDNATSSSTSADAVLGNSSISTNTATPFVDSIVGIWKSVKSAPVAVWNLTFGMALEKMFGEDKAIVLNILGAILGLSLIFAIIYLIASGDGR
jgi:hypothetical protein